MKKQYKILIAVAVIAIIAAFIFVAVKNEKAKEATGIPKYAISVQTEKAHKQDITTKVTAKGDVSLSDKVTIYAENQGKIDTVAVKEGDFVKLGQVLATYDVKSIETLQNQLSETRLSLKSAQLSLQAIKLPASDTEIMQAKASVTQAESGLQTATASLEQTNISIEQLTRNIADAKATFDNNTALFQQGAISKSELDRSKESYDALNDKLKATEAQKRSTADSITSSKNSIEIAKSQLAIIQNRQSDPKVKNQIAQQEVQIDQINLKITEIQKQINEFKTQQVATKEGTVTTVNVQAGGVVALGSPLFEIADINNLVIKVNISEYDAASVAIGQQTEIKGDSLGGKTYDGVVSKIDPVAEKKQTSSNLETFLTVEIKVNASTGLYDILKAGYTVEASIITNHLKDVVVVPIMATVSEKDGTQSVFIVKNDYKVEKRPVKILAYSDLYVQVDNVNLDEEVIVNPTPQIKEGIFVRPIKEKEATK